MNASKREKCAAASNTAYLVQNHIIWILGAIGLLFFSPNFYINLILAVTYFMVSLIFFHKIFGVLVCKMCVYKLSPPLSEDEYLSQYTKKFQYNYKMFVVVWVLIGWIWPISLMVISFLIFGQLNSIIFLIIFIGVAIIPFLIILNRNVCRECRIKMLGICPFQKKG